MRTPEETVELPASPCREGCGGCGRCCGKNREYVVISSFVWPPWPEKEPTTIKDENMQEIDLEGHLLEGYAIPTANTGILLIKAKRGFLGCGYFSLATADKVGDAAVIVSGVKNFEDMLTAKVKAVSPAAAARGVTLEMTGREALLKLV